MFKDNPYQNIALAVILSSVVLSACPQTPAKAAAPPQPTLASLNLSCGDFRDNHDGSWTPLHPVTVGPVQMGPGVSFREGDALAGIDVAALLNKECTSH
jgi:hypothetical protein